MEDDHVYETEDHPYDEEDETTSSSEEDEDSMKYINASLIDVRGDDPIELIYDEIQHCALVLRIRNIESILYYSIIATYSLQNIPYIT